MLGVGRGAAPFLFILIAWALATRAGVLPAMFLPPPGDVAATAWQMFKDGSLWINVGASVGRVLVSLAISVPLAVGFTGGSRRSSSRLRAFSTRFRELPGFRSR
jgi:ABC-type nitrate/sulfonate/bicarbonate transport system permease component